VSKQSYSQQQCIPVNHQSDGLWQWTVASTYDSLPSCTRLIFPQIYRITCILSYVQTIRKHSLCIQHIYAERNHVFKAGCPVPWSRVLLPFYRKKLDRSTQFGAIGYIITLFIKKLRKNLGVRPNFWGSGPPNLPVVAPTYYVYMRKIQLLNNTQSYERLDCESRTYRCNVHFVNCRNDYTQHTDRRYTHPTPYCWHYCWLQRPTPSDDSCPDHREETELTRSVLSDFLCPKHAKD